MKKKIISILLLIQIAMLVFANYSSASILATTVGTENFKGADGFSAEMTTTDLTYNAAEYYEEMGYYNTKKLVDPSYLTLCRKLKC